ncbi:unnamed protein product [Somion occarium]
MPGYSDHERLLQKFRTIISMLSVLRAHDPPALIPQAAYKGKDFKGSDALATLLVRSSEVVSIARRITPEELQLVAFVQDTHVNCPRTPNSDGSNCLTLPPWETIPHPHFRHGQIVTHPESPSPSLHDKEAEEYSTKEYIPAQWAADTFVEHAQNILELLGLPGEGDGLLHYITAQTHPKISRRMHHPRYSLPFYRAFTSDSFTPQPNIYAYGKWHDDDEYLQNILNNEIDVITQETGLKLPNLRKAAAGFRQSLYTADTYLEFSALLRTALIGFVGHLEVLQKLDSEHPAFPEAVRLCAIYGDSLRAIALSNVLVLHVQTNIMELRRVHQEVLASSAPHAHPPDDEEDLELLLAATPSLKRTGWDTYGHRSTAEVDGETFVRWLQLQTIYFRASRFADTVFYNIIWKRLFGKKAHLTILQADYVERSMAPWKDVVKKLNLGGDEECTPIKIIEMLEGKILPKEEWDFVQNAFQPDQPLSRGEFTGTLHCQAAMTAFVYAGQCNNSSYKWFQTADLGAFTDLSNSIGISQRCCPVCTKLLDYLPLDGENNPLSLSSRPKFIQERFGIQVARGSHTKISPCALPPWLPDSVIQNMLTHFERELTWDLEDLWRKRSQKVLPPDWNVSTEGGGIPWTVAVELLQPEDGEDGDSDEDEEDVGALDSSGSW